MSERSWARTRRLLQRVGLALGGVADPHEPLHLLDAQHLAHVPEREEDRRPVARFVDRDGRRARVRRRPARRSPSRVRRKLRELAVDLVHLLVVDEDVRLPQQEQQPLLVDLLDRLGEHRLQADALRARRLPRCVSDGFQGAGRLGPGPLHGRTLLRSRHAVTPPRVPRPRSSSYTRCGAASPPDSRRASRGGTCVPLRRCTRRPITLPSPIVTPGLSRLRPRRGSPSRRRRGRGSAYRTRRRAAR